MISSFLTLGNSSFFSVLFFILLQVFQILFFFPSSRINIRILSRHVSPQTPDVSPYFSMYKKAQHTPLFTLYHSLSTDTNLACFTLRQKALLINFIYLLNSFAIGNLFFFFVQSFPPVNFNCLFSFFAAHKIHRMDDRGYQVICLKKM